MRHLNIIMGANKYLSTSDDNNFVIAMIAKTEITITIKKFYNFEIHYVETTIRLML